MCGIVGFSSIVAKPEHIEMLCEVFRQSKIRGLHAFGYSYMKSFDSIVTRKEHDLETLLEKLRQDKPRELMGHCRYSTSGDYTDHKNNQPVHTSRGVMVFNGVIDMGTREEIELRYGVKMETDNDGELFLNRLDDVRGFIRGLTGSFAGLYMKHGEVHFIRNPNRPAYYGRWKSATYVASTADILRRAGITEIEELNPYLEFRIRDL